MATSKLFQLASKSAQRYTRREFGRTPMGRFAREVRRYTRGRGGERRLRTLAKELTSPETRRVVAELEKAGATLNRFSRDHAARDLLNDLFNRLGPLGGILRQVLGTSGRSATRDQLEAAAELIRVFGGEVLTLPGRRGHSRGVRAAQELLGRVATPPPPPTEVDDDWPEEHLVQQLGRGSIGFDTEATRELISREIKVSSSNVYSFVYEPETPRMGILYVTFLAWTPGSRRRSGPGPTYAYYDVPKSKYRRFEQAATAQSAGRAVWDYLRQRGSVHGHQHTYRIVAGTLVQEGGIYVPRKATASGFKRRAVAGQGVGRRSFQRSSLPERAFVSRGQPNRGR